MIVGACPYCNASNINGCPDNVKLPMFAKVKCDGCLADYWLKFSYFDPEAFTTESFSELYEVNEQEKSIKPTQKHAAAIKILDAIWSGDAGKAPLEKIHKDVIDSILSGAEDDVGFRGKGLIEILKSHE